VGALAGIIPCMARSGLPAVLLRENLAPGGKTLLERSLPKLRELSSLLGVAGMVSLVSGRPVGVVPALAKTVPANLGKRLDGRREADVGEGPAAFQGEAAAFGEVPQRFDRPRATLLQLT